MVCVCSSSGTSFDAFVVDSGFLFLFLLAFSRIPKSKWKRQRVLLTHEIRDTWLFSDIYSG